MLASLQMADVLGTCESSFFSSSLVFEVFLVLVLVVVFCFLANIAAAPVPTLRVLSAWALDPLTVRSETAFLEVAADLGRREVERWLAIASRVLALVVLDLVMDAD